MSDLHSDEKKADSKASERITVTLPGQPSRYIERRKKNDWVVRATSIVAVIGWICTLMALAFIDRASTLEDISSSNFFKITVISTWNTTMLRWAFIAVLISLLTCIVGLILNAKRHRRKTDRFNKLLVTTSVFSALIFIFYIVNFAKYM